jgi:nitrogen regulatory protein PII
MKLVVAIIRPDRLNRVLEELYRSDIQGLSISRVQGHGGEREHVETYRGTATLGCWSLRRTDTSRCAASIRAGFG